MDEASYPTLEFELPESPDIDIPARNLLVDLVALPVNRDRKVQTRVIVTPDPLVLYERQKVRWFSDHPFTILFNERIPLEAPVPGDVQIQAESRLKGGYKAEAVVRRDAASPRAYKYTVAVYDRESDRVYMADPDPVVEKDPRRG